MKTKLILTSVILMDILGSAEIDLFVPSFPELQTLFSLSPFWVEALLSVNFIGFCISLFIVGALADRYGCKLIILLSLLIFIVGSCLCLWALSYHFLLIGRFLQGVGIAAPATLCFIIIADLYPLEKQQFLIPILSGVSNLSLGAAPVVGSYITMYFHWQGNFMTLLLFGLFIFALTLFFIPSYKIPTSKNRARSEGYLSLIRSKPMLLLILTISFLCIPYYVFVGMSPLIYINDLGVSLSQFGYYQGSLAILYGLGSIFSGFITNAWNKERTLSVSNQICIFALGLILFLSFFHTKNPLLITVALLLQTLGTILPMRILYPLSLNFTPHLKGRASALFQALRLLLTSLSLEVAGYFYERSFFSTGIILSFLTLIAIITLGLVQKNKEIMEFTSPS